MDRSARPTSTTLALFNSIDLSHYAGVVDGHSAVAIFGNITGNLNAPSIPVGETRINVSAIFGSAKLKVPPDVAIKVTGLSVFSGVKVRGRRMCDGLFNFNGYETPGYSQAKRRLHINTAVIFGGLRIK